MYVWQLTCAIMDVCDPVQSILLPYMVGTSLVLVKLTMLNVSELEQWVTWSHIRTGINFPFWREKESNTLMFLLNQIILTAFYLWHKLHLKNQKCLFAARIFFEEAKTFLSYQTCSLMGNLELIGVWCITK